MDTKTYKVVGVSTSPQGETKIRFAQDLVSRIKTLVMRKHTNIVLREMPATYEQRISHSMDDHSGRFQQARSSIAGRWFHP
jgi:hypothetical protein